MNDIRARMRSVRSTMQITKAMELVATSKLRRAKEKAERTRPFYRALVGAIRALEASPELSSSPWSEKTEVKKTLYIVMAGDRGLAGGYNSSVFKLAESVSRDTEAIFLPIGRKALEYFRHTGTEIYTDCCEYISDLGVGEALSIGEAVANGYSSGLFDRVVVVYTRFVSMMSQVPATEQILPIDPEIKADEELAEPLIEGDAEELLSMIVPQYIGGLIWSTLCESVAAEHGARRNSMSSANKNASEMIDALTLKYNRARQAVITQEITEIVSGAEAL